MDSPIDALVFCDDERVKVTEILTQVRHWNKYTPEWLEKVVNENLGSFLEERFGKIAAKLCARLDVEPNELSYGATSLVMPGASYSVTYKAADKKSGALWHEVRFNDAFLASPRRIPVMLESLAMMPTQMTIELTRNIEPLSTIPSLKAKGWEVESQLPDQVLAKHPTGCSIEIAVTFMVFKGFSARDLWGDASDSAQAALVSAFVAELASPQ